MKIEMRIEKSQRVIVKLLVFSNDKKEILLVKTKHNYWDLPGGHLKFEETPEAGLVREAKEEIGIDVIIERLSSIHTIILDLIDRPNLEMRQYFVLVFIGSIADLEADIVLTDPEIIDYAWLSVQDIVNEKLNDLLVLTKEQIVLALEKKDIRANKKFYIKGGELTAYKIIED